MGRDRAKVQAGCRTIGCGHPYTDSSHSGVSPGAHHDKCDADEKTASPAPEKTPVEKMVAAEEYTEKIDY